MMLKNASGPLYEPATTTTLNVGDVGSQPQTPVCIVMVDLNEKCKHNTWLIAFRAVALDCFQSECSLNSFHCFVLVLLFV